MTASRPYTHNRETLVTWELGYMRNLGNRHAFGWTIFIHSGDDLPYRLGIKPRYRRWLAREIGLDISAGIAFSGSNPQVIPAYIAQTGLSIGDWCSLTAIVEVIPWEKRFVTCSSGGDQKGTEVSSYVGINLGSYPGTILTVAVFVAGIISAGSMEMGTGGW
ncbi:MAG: hypothetical protein ABII79_05265 [bacterium]